MEVASELGGRSVTATIKYGKGYEDSWLVFRGLPDEVFKDISATFGLQFDDVAGFTLSDLVIEATERAHSRGAVQQNFPETRPVRGSKANQKPDVKVDEALLLIEAVKPANDTREAKDQAIAELKGIYVKYQPLSPEASALWSKKGKELKA